MASKDITVGNVDSLRTAYTFGGGYAKIEPVNFGSLMYDVRSRSRVAEKYMKREDDEEVYRKQVNKFPSQFYGRSSFSLDSFKSRATDYGNPNDKYSNLFLNRFYNRN